MNMTIEVNEALEAIKAQVSEKFETVAAKADIAALTETKADASAVAELKGYFEALEAKCDAMPAPSILKATHEEVKSMNTVHEGFKKSFEATGKNHIDVELKAITQGREVTAW